MLFWLSNIFKVLLLLFVMNQRKVTWIVLALVVLLVFILPSGRSGWWTIFDPIGFGWILHGLTSLLAIIVLILAALWLFIQIKKNK
jgi:hypothetical protein